MELTIKSFEGNIYLVSENGTLLTNQFNTPVRFDSISQIKEHYRSNMPSSVTLEQHTPYDEMCGLTSATTPLVIPLHW
ncbi:DUF6482 family protein [Thalassotalea ponticola]|uniref:DUF6482 family protein n=1 Tax=Thalassotalea ponticola TaxID=1523392 RepID=UPI0025B40003|nr:DUF6482 family protein [Thalassotalea ponticola]MDN3652224.1 DUF6482 family protein [Thalassotalea ponticola]